MKDVLSKLQYILGPAAVLKELIVLQFILNVYRMLHFIESKLIQANIRETNQTKEATEQTLANCAKKLDGSRKVLPVSFGSKRHFCKFLSAVVADDQSIFTQHNK